jgi:hypothetical protein
MEHKIFVVPKDDDRGYILAGEDARSQFIAEKIMNAIGGGRPYGTIEDAKNAITVYQKKVMEQRPEALAVAEVTINI